MELAPFKRHQLSPGAYCMYVPNFYGEDVEHELFKELMTKIPFKQQENVFAGKVSLEPRLSCWYGEYPYSYNPRLKHKARVEQFFRPIFSFGIHAFLYKSEP